MTVYTVTSVSVLEGDEELSTKVFATYDLAKAFFDKCVKETKENDHLYNNGEPCEDTVVEEKQYSFCIYSDGEYCVDHYRISIEEYPVLTEVI